MLSPTSFAARKMVLSKSGEGGKGGGSEGGRSVGSGGSEKRSRWRGDAVTADRLVSE